MGEKKPFHDALAALAGKLGDLPRGPEPEPPPQAKGPARAVVRRERKGRRGKEVTVVGQLGLSPAELERWLRELKDALGCGGTVEDGELVLQGDQRPRVVALLEKRGVCRVLLG